MYVYSIDNICACFFQIKIINIMKCAYVFEIYIEIQSKHFCKNEINRDGI